MDRQRQMLIHRLAHRRRVENPLMLRNVDLASLSDSELSRLNEQAFDALPTGRCEMSRIEHVDLKFEFSEPLSATWPRISQKREQHLRESKHSFDLKKDQAYWRAKFNECLVEFVAINRELNINDYWNIPQMRHLPVSLRPVRSSRLLRQITATLRMNAIKKKRQEEELKWGRKFYACMSELVKTRRECDRLCRSEWASTSFVVRVKEKFPSALLAMISLRRHAGMYCVTFPK